MKTKSIIFASLALVGLLVGVGTLIRHNSQLRAEKVNEEQAIVQGLADIGYGLQSRSLLMYHFDMQLCHELEPSAEHIHDCMKECRDSLLIIDSVLRRQLTDKRTRLAQIRETDTATAPIKYAVAHIKMCLENLDHVKNMTDTTLKKEDIVAEFKKAHTSLKEMKKNVIEMKNAVEAFDKKWSLGVDETSMSTYEYKLHNSSI